MSPLWLLVLLSPLLLALLIIGVVAVMAVRRVQPQDVPVVLRALVSLLEPLARKLPSVTLKDLAGAMKSSVPSKEE